jgi:GNAT superfamily N-acetyltransferase
MYEIRTMLRAEIDLAVEWAAQEGWNPGLYDADCFYRTDPEGFSIGVLNGEPVGSISAVSYGASYGFLGFYIVRPDFRGQGLGIQLWQEAMKRLSGRNVGLDGVVAQQDNYKKTGFKLAYRNIRYLWCKDRQSPIPQGTVILRDVPRESLLLYDRQLFGVDRAGFLDCWISRPETTALAIVDGSKVLAYGVLRTCREGFKIGPLFADAADLAEALFLALTENVGEGAQVFLDVPEVNLNAVQLTKRYAMTKVFETARMYTGEEPKIPLNRWFGVTSFELG